jgi:hypothetical protein
LHHPEELTIRAPGHCALLLIARHAKEQCGVLYPDQEPDLGLRHVQFIMQLRNDRRRDQKRHAHGDASKPEETKQSSKTAGRATVAARTC